MDPIVVDAPDNPVDDAPRPIERPAGGDPVEREVRAQPSDGFGAAQAARDKYIDRLAASIQGSMFLKQQLTKRYAKFNAMRKRADLQAHFRLKQMALGYQPGYYAQLDTDRKITTDAIHIMSKQINY